MRHMDSWDAYLDREDLLDRNEETDDPRWDDDPGPDRIRLQADPGMFRVVGVDTFEGPGAEYMIGDFDDPNDACQTAREHGGTMNPVYVYDDEGVMVFKAGSY
jgi:hypothetical protein